MGVSDQNAVSFKILKQVVDCTTIFHLDGKLSIWICYLFWFVNKHRSQPNSPRLLVACSHRPFGVEGRSLLFPMLTLSSVSVPISLPCHSGNTFYRCCFWLVPSGLFLGGLTSGEAGYVPLSMRCQWALLDFAACWPCAQGDGWCSDNLYCGPVWKHSAEPLPAVDLGGRVWLGGRSCVE
jgi:hypothetical protein